MNKPYTLIACVILGTASANAAISLAGTALRNVQGSSAADLASGRLGLLIVDTGSDGFLKTDFSSISGNPISSSSAVDTNANISLGSLFYGDYVLARLTTGTSFGDTVIAGSFTGSIAGYENKQYAIVWFESLNTSGSETKGSGKFGIARGGDWTMPASDTGTFTFGAALGNLDQITLANGGGTGSATVNTANEPQSVSFATAGTSLTITPVPEPTTALLAAFGSLALLRRRRPMNV